MASKLLVLDNVSKYYTSTQSVVVGLNNIRLGLDRGEFVAITGESGSGKSTLAHVLGGILPYESGELLLSGSPTSHFDGSDWERYRRDNISFISQNYGILVGCTVLENVVSALHLTGMEKPQAVARAEQILQEVELWELRSRRAAKLSSGQKQRLSIARALAKPAPILIADEPTGNLDPENSAKIMKLLAHAARDRLVILITHEFEEAQDYATRHIVMQDGVVVMDAALRPALPPAPWEPGVNGKRRNLSGYVARLQLSGRPVWASLVLLFFALTAFAVFSFLGTFIVALDDSSTRIYDNSAFRNGDQQRIVISAADHRPMTREDFSAILAVEHVSALEPWGYVTDINYAWRDGVDYTSTYKQHNIGSADDPQMVTEVYRSLNSNASYLQTLPKTADDSRFLTAGRLPEQFYEVVLCGSADQIGSEFTVYIQDQKHWPVSELLPIPVQVVGVTDQGSGLYFHSDLGRLFTHVMRTGAKGYAMTPYQTVEQLLNVTPQRRWQGTFLLVPEDTLADDQCRLSAELSAFFQNRGSSAIALPNVNTENRDPLDPEGYTVLQVQLNAPHSFESNLLVQVSRATFDRLTDNKASDQISITTSDYAYTQRVLDSLHGMGYLAVSPFKEGSTEVVPSLAKQRMQTLTVCIAALLAIVALQLIVLRALFGTQVSSYQLLSNIGLGCATARFSVLWQVLLFTAGGQILGGLGIFLGAALNIRRIVHLTRYLPPVYVLLLVGVHLMASLIAALWIIRAITRQVYPLANKETDLVLETEEVAV